MKKVILIYGLIAGAIVGGMMFITMPLYQNGTLHIENGELLGYTTMVVALTMVFFGVKSYRDNYSKGVITFGKGFKVGILITLVACSVYALSWEVSYNSIGDEFMAKYSESHFAEMKKNGATETEIAEAKEQMASFNEMYKNPIVRFLFTAFVEMFIPVGLPIALLSAAILRRKEILPAT